MRHPTRRNAVTLIIVLAVMALIGGVIVVLTYHSAAMHQQLRDQRLQAAARFSTQSATALLRRSPESITAASEPQALDLKPLLTGGIDGTGSIQCVTSNGATSCEIDIRLQQSRKIIRRCTPVTIHALTP